MSEKEIGVEEARKTLGNLINDAALEGAVTYLTRRGRRYAAIAPLDRIKGTAVIVTTTYIRITDEGAETTTIARNGEQVSEVYKVDGGTVDSSIVADSDADEYLRNRDMELRGEGYVLA